MATHMNSYIVSPEQGSVWEMEPGRPITFKLLSEQTSDSVTVFESVVPAGGGPPLHLHRTSDEVIHVLAGEFTFKIGEELSTAGTGTWVFIPRGIAHAWKNSGDAPGRAFFIFTPADGAKVFEEARLLQVPMTSIELATLESLFERYGYEFLGPPL